MLVEGESVHVFAAQCGKLQCAVCLTQQHANSTACDLACCLSPIQATSVPEQ